MPNGSNAQTFSHKNIKVFGDYNEALEVVMGMPDRRTYHLQSSTLSQGTHGDKSVLVHVSATGDSYMVELG